MNTTVKPLIIYEMANNHSGSVEHGKKIIDAMKSVSIYPEFDYAFKFQYRTLETFIHKDYKSRMDLKNIKRFSETKLNEAQFLELKKYAEDQGFLTLTTPFDEDAVDRAVKHGYKYIKIASCSFTDWPLLEKIAKTDLPIIASTAGATKEEIYNVAHFFLHRNKDLSIMHCVAEYPTKVENLQLNQIDLIKKMLPDVRIGYSTHESPDNYSSVGIAVAKGASIFEKHVGVATDTISLNAYSANAEQIANWLAAIKNAYLTCGLIDERPDRTEKEAADLHALQRGVFAKRKILKGEYISSQNSYFAIPSLDDQIIANDLSKYNEIMADRDIEEDEAVLISDVKQIDTREMIEKIYNDETALLEKSGIALAPESVMEISHHYGVENFYKTGTCIIEVINREYCKKILVQLPGQDHPTHTHLKKEETFQVLYGDIEIKLDGVSRQCKAGDIVTVERGVKHSFSSVNGGIFEEVSSTHYVDDSFYEDDYIMNNKRRKTKLTYYKNNKKDK